MAALRRDIGVFAEDDERILQLRHRRICEAYEIFHGDVAPLLHLGSFVGMDMEFWRDQKPTEKCREIEDYLERHPDVRLLILDNVSDVFGGNEYVRREVRLFIQRLTALARRHELAILLLAHTSKSQGQQAYLAASGSTGWVNSCRSVLRLSADHETPGIINLEHLKANYCPRIAPIPLKMKGAALVHASQSDIEAADFDQLDALVLANIRKQRNIGQNISMARNAHNFVGKLLKKKRPNQNFATSPKRENLRVPKTTLVGPQSRDRAVNKK